MNTTGSPTVGIHRSRGSAEDRPARDLEIIIPAYNEAQRLPETLAVVQLTSAVCRSTRRSWSWTTEVSIAPLICWRISSTATCRCMCSVAMSRARVRLCVGVCCQAARQWSGSRRRPLHAA